MKVENYEVGPLIGETSKFRIYLGNDEEQQAILKVAKTFEDGDLLAEEAGWFNTIQVFINQIATLQQEMGETSAHYDWLFANLQSSFMEPTQGDRRISIFHFADTKLDQLVPLSKLSSETHIDARTSVWILGRLLKIYGFYEAIAAISDNPIARYTSFSPGDYFIGPERHRLIYYNHCGSSADVVANEYISQIAEFIIRWTVFEKNTEEQKYYALLNAFAETGLPTFEQAHRKLYDLVEQLWGLQYHPFTYRSNDSEAWKTIKEE